MGHRLIQGYRGKNGCFQKLELKKCNNNLLKFSFANRCVNCWNALPDNVVNSSSINMFMSRLNNVNLNEHLKGRTLVDF